MGLARRLEWARRRIALWERTVPTMRNRRPRWSRVAAQAPTRASSAGGGLSHRAAAIQIGRAHVCTPVTNAQLVCRLLLEQNNTTTKYQSNMRTQITTSNLCTQF